MCRVVRRHRGPRAGGGLAFGLVAALSTTASLRAALFETSPYDPLIFTIVVVVAGLTVVLSVVPVIRTGGINPVAVLRRE